MEEALVAQLLADAGLALLVADRITWNLRPQNGPLPAIVLHLISSTPDYTMVGRLALTDNLVQMDCWGGTYAQAKTLSRALAAALDSLADPFRGPGFIEQIRDDAFREEAPRTGAATTDLHRTSLDVRAWHIAP